MGLDIYFFELQKNTTTPVSELTEQPIDVGYFRKVNALLNWINTHVEPVQNCVDIDITRSHLQRLYDNLTQLTPKNCGEQFPTTEGFFFGSTEYDHSYWQGVHDVKVWVHDILETFDFDESRLVFHAWW
ncbi:MULTISPECIES: hypothetical protein [unclassified Photorhabdus]|uniref:hypothetical protein n=1 Tax=unclassified Photorhabdus TaxID=2620880 RepID=UPI000DCC23B5|nr:MULTISPECIES: hypothetical protein [unclassified Photorhabdus]RAW71937.1 hypothetical protein CKY15_08410 [Photorhabdus sp. S7-51]RAW73532.1 hypothetical protein CKY14_07725 [Photorhabdus sp. S14-60]RAW78466.1 hypothetical protein CKY06_07905 [Photorhabdus sp. S15-56]HEN3291938.1 hypothetical protein [Yersinia enterocolitica]